MTCLVLKAINAVQIAAAEKGIAKNRRNKEQNFNFRGIDDALEAFGPLLASHGILLSPSYSNLRIEPRQTKSGGTTYNASVEGTFTFTHMEDGSTFKAGPFYGEANDGQDKAVSKATSVAERNMFFLTFVVPHEPAIGGDPDEGSGESAEDATGQWLRVINGLQEVEAYQEARADVIKAYGTPNDVPGVLRNALNVAKARCLPKDE